MNPRAPSRLRAVLPLLVGLWSGILVPAAPPPEEPSSLAALVPDLEAVRGLSLKTPVAGEWIDREALRAHVIEQLERGTPPAVFAGWERVYRFLGLWPEGRSFREGVIAAYTANVGGFYDPRTRKLYLLKDSREILARMAERAGADAGAQQGYLRLGQRVIILHELCHALDDQHFDLQAGLDRVQGRMDAELGFLGLVEGTATLAVVDWVFDVADLPDAQRRMVGRVFEQVARQSPGVRGDVPPFLAAIMTFPYLRGADFVEALRTAGGWAAVNAAFRRPPVSTMEILHPERYGRVSPPRLETPGAARALAGLGPVVAAEVGEYVIALALAAGGVAEEEAAAAADGWLGDRLLLAGGAPTVCWFTHWTSPVEAEEFRAALEAAWAGRGVGDRPARGPAPGGMVLERRDRTVQLFRGDPALPAARARRLRRRCWKGLAVRPARP